MFFGLGLDCCKGLPLVRNCPTCVRRRAMERAIIAGWAAKAREAVTGKAAVDSFKKS